ncbi:MAG: 6-bladed beta-propeller [Gemmatimonadales bacterium]
MLARCPPRLAILAMLLAGCGSPDGRAHSRVRDSSGIRIVEVAAGATERTLWTVREDLSVEAPTGQEPYAFGQIVDVDEGPGEVILVLDATNTRLLEFSRDGRFERAVGRAGRGPGELTRFVTDLLPTEHGVLVPDPGAARITRFGHDTVVTGVPASPAPKSWALVAHDILRYRALGVSRRPDGAFAFWDGLLQIDLASGTIDTLLELDYPKTDLGGPGNIKIPLLVNAAFWAPLRDGRVAWSSLDRDQVSVHDASGALRMLIHRADWRAHPASDADRATLRRLLAEKLRILGGDVGAANAPNVVFPDRLPAITGLLAGPDGTLWVQRMGEVGDIDPMAVNAPDRTSWLGGAIWDVFSSDGHYLGLVTLPRGVRVTAIREPRLFGIGRDGSGADRVVRLVLDRS